MRQYIDAFFILAILLTFYSCGIESNTQNSKGKPNILLILTDDMGYGDVELSGNNHIRTPNLDDLAEHSVQFKNFYVSPVCAPTRASLLTGRYHQRTGVRSVTNGYETMDPNEITLAEILKSNGYRTGIFGKWHLGEYYPSVPNAQGFDEYLGFRTGHTNYYYDAEIERNGKPHKTQGHITDVLTEAALDFMTEDQNEPFFCYLAYNAPHTPLQVDSSWWKKYTKTGLAEREARIYGMIEQLDQGIGQIMDSLSLIDILENTVVIFMSDNGPTSGWRVPQDQMRYNAGLRDQKFTTYDGGIRTQCYWKWSNQWKPRLEETVGAHIDVLPTLLEISGIELPESHPAIDGKSLLTTLKGEPTDEKARFFFQKYSIETLRDPAPFPGGIARKGPWKMVNGDALYNLEDDIGEHTNLADLKPEIFSRLKAVYLEWYQGIADDRNFEKTRIEVGHQQENPIYLQPHHGIAEGNVGFWGNRGTNGKRKGKHPTGVDGDWTGGWQAKGDAIKWDITFVEPGDYSFSLVARDTTSNAIENLLLHIKEKGVTLQSGNKSLTPEWAEYELGFTYMDKGSSTLTIALEDDIEAAMEIRALVITSMR